MPTNLKSCINFRRKKALAYSQGFCYLTTNKKLAIWAPLPRALIEGGRGVRYLEGSGVVSRGILLEKAETER